MRTIVNGQSIVTAAEFIEVAAGFETEPLDLTEEFTAGGLASRDALTSFLADLQVETDTDREDAAYYKSLLRRMPRELRTGKTAVPAPAAVVVAELVAADDALGYEADDITADWTAADFDSYEVLATTGSSDPAAAVARARAPRAERREVRAALRVVRNEPSVGVAA
ncbi:hypothetical protein [Streptomyces sp. AMCC400023]|uniref:hypothetical protein n=1 Tax=Streptomyces sp. AMCC400023 TaxID=2056258 RepID=UPI001F2D0A52|nr:hypothetical protein [Streptomyces sp. AMCC400023]UJV47340.1 hypothetical protein CVT30_46955 [Streptomyces sp. AMCC400023]